MTSSPSSVSDHLWSSAQRDRLVRLCAAVVGDLSIAEDLAQETLLEAWRHRGRLIQPAGTDAWLNAIARNVCRRWLRARGGRPVPAPFSMLEEASEARDLDSVLEREEVIELLERALGLLPPATREALVGHYVEELSHAEIADRIGTSEDAVSMRVTRGRRRLRYLLETRFAGDTVAEGWSRPHETGWLATRLSCPDCGTASTQMRHDEQEVAFRCLACDPAALTVRLPLTAPAFTALLGGVRRPSAIQARVAVWTRSYWTEPDPKCVRCDHPVSPRPYTRSEADRWACRRGWQAECGVCGETVSGSMAGLTLAQPEAAEARRRHPRLRALPARDVVRDGLDAKVVAYGTPDGTPWVSAVFARDSLRLLHVEASAAE